MPAPPEGPHIVHGGWVDASIRLGKPADAADFVPYDKNYGAGGAAKKFDLVRTLRLRGRQSRLGGGGSEHVPPLSSPPPRALPLYRACVAAVALTPRKIALPPLASHEPPLRGTRRHSPPLLEGWRVWVSPGTKPPRKELGPILANLGATVLAKLPAAGEEGGGELLVLATADDLGKARGKLRAEVERLGALAVDVKWLTHGLVKYELNPRSPPKEHVLVDAKVKKRRAPASTSSGAAAAAGGGRASKRARKR